MAPGPLNSCRLCNALWNGVVCGYVAIDYLWELMLWCASTCSLDFTVALSAKFWPGMTWSPDLGSVGWLISACNFAQSIRSQLAHQKVDRARFLATLNESIALTKKAFKNPTNGWSWRSWVSRLISEMAALKSFVFPFWSCLFLSICSRTIKIHVTYRSFWDSWALQGFCRNFEGVCMIL